MLERQEVKVNLKKVHRLYRGEGLMVRRRRSRRRAVGSRAPLALPQGPNRRRSLDVVADQLATGLVIPKVNTCAPDRKRPCATLVYI